MKTNNIVKLLIPYNKFGSVYFYWHEIDSDFEYIKDLVFLFILNIEAFVWFVWKLRWNCMRYKTSNNSIN